MSYFNNSISINFSHFWLANDDYYSLILPKWYYSHTCLFIGIYKISCVLCTLWLVEIEYGRPEIITWENGRPEIIGNINIFPMQERESLVEFESTLYVNPHLQTRVHTNFKILPNSLVFTSGYINMGGHFLFLKYKLMFSQETIYLFETIYEPNM